MKILVTGACGMLGSEICSYLEKNNISYIATDTKGDVAFLNISDIESILKMVKDNNISSIINCAAWTAVDDAEDNINKNKVDEVNIKGLNNICKIAQEYDCKLLHISTDYVFDGQGDKPWKESDIPANPINYYGLTKLQGEKLVEKLDKYFITRIQWTYGKNGKNFVDTMLKLAETHDEVRVVNDQIGSPTYVKDLAKTLVEIVLSDKYGYYHIASSGDYVSWYEFCKEIYKQAGVKTKVTPVTTKEYGLSKAKRPYNSRLDRTKYVERGFTKLPDWKASLTSYLKEIGRL